MPRGIKDEAGYCLESLPTDVLRSGVFTVRDDHELYGQSILELAESIAASGIIEPLVVRQTEDAAFEVIAGERRLKAAKLLNLREVPCVIIAGCSPNNALMISLTENLQRVDLNPIEKARGLRRLLEDFQLTQEAIAKRIGMSQSAIAHHFRLLGLPLEIQELIRKDVLSIGHGKVLAGIEDQTRAVAIASKCASEHTSVRELEASLATSRSGGQLRKQEGGSKKLREERELPNGVFLVIREHVTMPTQGTIEIPYYSEKEKQWIMSVLSSTSTASRDATPTLRVHAP